MLARIPNIKAVLFDVYGTLFVSSAHNIQSLERTATDQAFCEALASVGLDCRCPGSVGVQRLAAIMRSVHEAAHRRGNHHPEVDIQEIWNLTLKSLANDGALEHVDLNAEQVRQLAVEFECRTNPVWPMPHAAWCLKTLHEAGITLGLISNAQFFTKELFPALLGATVAELGFAPELQFYSYEHGAREARDTSARCRSQRTRPGGTFDRWKRCVSATTWLNDVIPAADLDFARPCSPVTSAVCAGSLVRSGLTSLPISYSRTSISCPPVWGLRGTRYASNLPWHDPLWSTYVTRAQLFG